MKSYAALNDADPVMLRSFSWSH